MRDCPASMRASSRSACDAAPGRPHALEKWSAEKSPCSRNRVHSRPSETTPNADCFGVGWYRHTNSWRKLVRPRHETHECCWRLCVNDSEQLMVRLTKKLTAM